VLHRDLKPDNIMVGKYGETLVVDWGLAKPLGQTASPLASEAPLRPTSASGSTATMAGATVGTPAYMSPEQAAGRLDLLGAASDVYAGGADVLSRQGAGRGQAAGRGGRLGC
ncbi:MAG: serine/threonine protein kinase, partial [Pirellulales bacterium]